MLMLCLAGCANPVKEGTKYLKNGNYEAASDSFQKAVEKKKDLKESYRGLGIALWEMKDYEKAKDAFEKALENGGEETASLYNLLGICDLELSDPAGALQNFWKGLSMEGTEEALVREMKYNEIIAYERLKDWDSAKEKMAEYVERYPDDEQAAKEAEFLETR